MSEQVKLDDYRKWVADECPPQEQIEVAVERLGFHLKSLPVDQLEARENVLKILSFLNRQGRKGVTGKKRYQKKSEGSEGELNFSPLVDYSSENEPLMRDDTTINSLLESGLLVRGMRF